MRPEGWTGSGRGASSSRRLAGCAATTPESYALPHHGPYDRGHIVAPGTPYTVPPEEDES
jgi:hypothetical protein